MSLHTRIRFAGMTGALVTSLALWPGSAGAQSRDDGGSFIGQQGGYSASAPVDHPAVAPGSILLDRVVAVINGVVILESDVLEEEHFTELQPYRSPGEGTPKQQALQHLISRTLILQQIKEEQTPVVVTDAELQKQLDDLRKHLPACEQGKCQSAAGWQSILEAHGFTPAQFERRWRQRMVVLKFVEQRFRTGVRISKPDIQAYYTNFFAPQFAQSKLSPPPLAAVSARIDEILLQQHVNGLLQEWLSSLKDQGSVAILDATYAPPAQAASDPASDNDPESQGDER